jgi:hypothetical protein
MNKSKHLSSLERLTEAGKEAHQKAPLNG